MANTPIFSDFTLGNDHYLILRLESEGELEHLRELIETAYAETPMYPPGPTDILLSSVDVEEKRAGAGVADITVAGADIDTLHFALSDPRFVVKGANGNFDLMLADDIALSHAETPTLPLTITTTDLAGHTYSKDFTIEVIPSEPMAMPTSEPIERRADLGHFGEYLGPIGQASGPTEVDPGGPRMKDRKAAQLHALPEIQAFNVAHPLERDYKVIYHPSIDPRMSVKDNLMKGELGAVYEGGWGYKEAIEIRPGDDAPFQAPYLRTHMQKGSHAGTKDLMRGAGFDTRTFMAERAYFAYSLRFKEGFQFNKGGKLPGAGGGDTPSGGNLADQGFSARMMWRDEGKAELYLYCWNQNFADGTIHDTGRSRGRGAFHFQPGLWHRIEQEMKLNTIDPDGTIHADGWIRLWIDGMPLFEQREVIFRIDRAVKCEGFMNTIFFGGSSSGWEALRDEYVDHGDFVIAA